MRRTLVAAAALLAALGSTAVVPAELGDVTRPASATRTPSPAATTPPSDVAARPTAPTPAPTPTTTPTRDPRRVAAAPTERTTPTIVPTVPTAPPPPAVTTPEGWQAVDVAGAPVGTDGPVRTYSVEWEPGLPVDLADYAATAVAALEDPDRGWTSTGRRRLQQVTTGADLRVVLATPATVDAHCALAGLRTNGIFSCWVDGRAMLNADRWQRGSAAVPDLATYRTYLVNHEVGHGLGLGHVGCPAPGGVAPVMMQQTKTTDGCLPNGWPHP